MSFPADEMQDIIDDFISEAQEGLESLDQKFVELEKNPNDTTLLNDIFRSVHTIKGAAGFLGFQQVVDVTHVTEDVLNKLRKGEIAVDASIMDAILESTDMIKLLIHNVKEKVTEPVDTSGVVSSMKSILEGPAPAAPAKGKKATKGAAKGKKTTKGAARGKKAAKAPAAKARKTSRGTAAKGGKAAKAPAAKAEAEPKAAANTEGAVTPEAPSAGQPARTQPAEQPKQPGEQPKGMEGVTSRETNIRVDTERLDSVMNLIGELVLSRNRLMTLGGKLQGMDSDHEVVSNMNEGIAQLDVVTTDLQLAVMKMRMQPIAKVFNKFPRMVRDLARQKDKEIELVIKGEETELDKTVIEEIGDPLVHLIRNSADHGLESPEEREAAGKPRCGTLTLSAYQEGRHIMVAVEDDGRGINTEAVKRSAVEKGLIPPEEAERLSDKEAWGLIFLPGFSTAAQVSDISGRGVGMDVVKTNISRINGTINIDSAPGKGTRITFTLPLTLAIIQVLTVEAGSEIYGIPLSNVTENIRVDDADIKFMDGKEVIHIRDQVFPVVRLGNLVVGSEGDTGPERKYIVIISIGETSFGLLVDRLHGQEEIVMKSMGEYLKGTDGVAGACITGDGNVILILDVMGMMETAKRAHAH